MAPVEDVTQITVEGYTLSNNNRDTRGLSCSLRIGTRTVSPRATAPANNLSACADAFEFGSSVDDTVTLEITDTEANGAEAPVGIATFSLSQARQAGQGLFEVPVLSAESREQQQQQLGVMSLSIQSADRKGPAATTAAASGNTAAATTDADTVPVAGAATASVPGSYPPSAFCMAQDDDEAQQEAGASPASNSGGAPASASVMAAMVAVAAMVAAAAELPAPCSVASSSGSSGSKGTKGGPLMPSGGGAAPTVAFYPRIQPYDAAPPLEFGPGRLPSGSSGAAAFYPDIAVRMHFPDIPSRLHELRPTLSAPGA